MAQASSKAVMDLLKSIGNIVPGVPEAATAYGNYVARGVVQRLLGFWVLYQLGGGNVRSMIARGFGSYGNAYTQLGQFEKTFGMTPDEFMPEVAALIREIGAAGTAGLPKAG